ncbi:MAG: head GIN domain-containing protein [Pseudomonadota bacterium]
MNTIRKTLSLTSLLLAATLAQAADSETRNLADFDSIEVGGGIDLVLKQGAAFSVQVNAEDGDLDELITEVRGNTLYIHRDDSDGWRGWRDRDWQDDYSADVTLPVLQSLEASGGSDVEATGTFTGDRITVRASGGSDIELDVAVDTIRVTASGGSDLELSGTANHLRADSSGGSDLEASDLTAKEVDVTSSGGSDARVTVTESLTADASGGSDIHYSGDPQFKDIDKSGAADVTQR